MEREIHSIIDAVRSREERRRRTALSINAVLLFSIGTVPIVLALYYPWWLLFMWIPPLVVAALFIARSEYQSIRVSRDEASLILDLALKTKERVQTFALISQSSAAPDLVRSAFIAHQIRGFIPPSFTPQNILDLRPTRSQRWAIAASVSSLTIALGLYLLRPISPLQQTATSIHEIIAEHPELPEQVKLAAQESLSKLSQSDLVGAQESLQKTAQEISRALALQSPNSPGERTVQQQADSSSSSNFERQRQTTPPQAPAQPSPQSKGDSKNSQSPEKNRGDDEKVKQPDSPQNANDQAEGGKDKNDSTQSKERSDEGASEGAGQSNDEQSKGNKEQESKDKAGAEGEKPKQPEDGDGQGSGQGEGSSGSGSGTQGENQQEGSQSKGSSGAAQKGGGQGEGNSQEGSDTSQSQGGSAQTGKQQEGSNPGTKALEQLQNAVNKASQEVEKEQQRDQKEGKEQEGSQGNQGNQAGDKKSSTSQDAKNKEGKGTDAQGRGDQAKGEHDGDSQGESEASKRKQSNQQGRDGSNEPRDGKDQSAKDKKGAGEKGPESKDKEQKNDPKQKGETGSKDSLDSSKESNTEERKDAERPQDSKSDGVGDLSASPDRSAKAIDQAPPSEGEGSDLSALPSPVKESQIGGEQEQLDQRFTGSDSTLEENKAPAQAQTTLDDVILAKPQGSTHKRGQPIPLEYRDILESGAN